MDEVEAQDRKQTAVYSVCSDNLILFGTRPCLQAQYLNESDGNIENISEKFQ